MGTRVPAHLAGHTKAPGSDRDRREEERDKGCG
jgi:hypothetical protein